MEPLSRELHYKPVTGIFVDKSKTVIENLKINTQSSMVLESFISLIDWLICKHDVQHKKHIMFYSMW